MLPAPQVSDQELQEIAKMGYASDLVSAGGEDLVEGTSATHVLLTKYYQTPIRQSMTPFQTPQRTPAGKADATFVPEKEDFEESELQEADLLIKEEIKFLRVAAMGHEQNSEKLSTLQNEFDNLKRRMDEEAKKATKIEQKIEVQTHGYQTRSGKLWSQIEATFKQLDTAGTELECFLYLQKQEQLASTYRVCDLIEQVNKQKELERELQYRYGNLLA